MSTVADMISAAFCGQQTDYLAATQRRRRKVWDLPKRWHCPLVGTCLPVPDLRKLAHRCGFDERTMSEYTLHTAAVGHCEVRTPLSEGIQRYFDKRYASTVATFSRAKGEAAVLTLWNDALASGEVTGALWAAWSHPDLTDSGGNAIYGDIHMLSHQIGSEARAELRQLERLKQDNVRLRDEAQALRHGLRESQRLRDKALAELERRRAETEQRVALLARREVELAEARAAARDYDALFTRAQAMGQRIETLEERNATHARLAAAFEAELGESRAELAAAEAALESALGLCEGIAGSSGCGRTCGAEAQLAGRCVLCIGGRTNLVDGYRRMVETRGGRFVHHDDGQEESLHRIDAAVGNADAVVCQAGCVSHAAYYRLKEACKKLGKPCVFVKSPGVGSFARSLAVLATGEDAETQRFGRLSN
jgi:hypothetical protein